MTDTNTHMRQLALYVCDLEKQLIETLESNQQ